MHRIIFMSFLLAVCSTEAATREENLRTCMTGQYKILCKHGLLSQSELRQVKEAERRENLSTCSSGKYPSLCNRSLLSKAELKQVIEAERLENLSTCLNGAYPTLCNHSLLTAQERSEVNKAEKSASERAKQPQQARPVAPVLRSRDGYLIEVAHNDELFIINGEKYEAQTYCLGWDEGEEVLFLEGSPYGACASAKLYNFNRRESCDVWCE